MNFKKIYTIRYVFYVIIIVAVSAYLILLTYGYRINWQNRTLQKVSAMYIASIPQDVKVFIDSKEVSNTTPLKVTNLFPGRYDVRIENDLYETWDKTLNVKSDYVPQEQDIVLILKDRKETEMSDNEKKTYEDFFQNEDKVKESQKNLYIKDNNELYFDNVLISRFSQEIKNAVWYADKKHIIYQLNDQIYFMDTDGTNNIELAKLSSNDKANFISSGEGKYLIYQNGDDMKKVQITNIDSLFREKYFNKASKIIK